MRVSNEDGTAVSGAVVGFHYSSCVLGSSEGLTTSFPSIFFLGDESITQKFVTDTSGVATINVLPCTTDGTPLSVDVTPPSTADGSQLVATVAALVPFPSADESSSPPIVVLHPRPKPVTFSGALTQSDGVTGVGSIKLMLFSGAGSFSTTTSADGSFSFIVPPGTYGLTVDGRQSPSYPFQYGVGGIDLSSSLLNQNLSFAADRVIQLRALDESGAPVIGATVKRAASVFSCGYTKPLSTSFRTNLSTSGDGDFVISATTDGNGIASLVFPASCLDTSSIANGLVQDHQVQITVPLGSHLISPTVDLAPAVDSVTVTLQTGNELSGQIVASPSLGFYQGGEGIGSQQLVATSNAGSFPVPVSGDGHFDTWLPADVYTLTLPGNIPWRGNAPSFFYGDGSSTSIGTIDGVDLRTDSLISQTITIPPVSFENLVPLDADGNRLWGYQAHVDSSLTCQIPAVKSSFGTPEAGPVVTYIGSEFYACADLGSSPQIHSTITPVGSLAQQYQAMSFNRPADFVGLQTDLVPLTPQPPHREFSYCSDRFSGGTLVSVTTGDVFQPNWSPTQCTIFTVPADSYRLVLNNTSSSILDLTTADLTDLRFPQPNVSVSVVTTDTSGTPAGGVSLSLNNYICSGNLETSIGKFPFSYRLDSQSSSTNSDGLGGFSLPLCETSGNTTLTVSPPASSNLGGETLSYVLPFTNGQIVPVALSSFEGTFTDAVGSILPDQTLSIVSGSGEVVSSDSSGPDGGVSLTADPGVYTFDATGSIGDPVTYSVAIPKVDLTHHNKVDLALPTKLIPISVVDDSGEPIPNATITLASSPTSFAFLGGTATGTEYGIEKTDAAGKAVLEVLPSDALSVSVTGPAGSTKQPVQRLLSSASTGQVTVTLHEMAPTITSASSSTFTVGTPKSFSITTTGSPSALITESGTLPAGLSFHHNANGTATISGTPSASGSATVSITAANGVGTNATQSLTISVNQAPLTISTSSLPAGSLYSKSHKVLYSATLAAFSGNGAYGWRLAADSSLPPGLKLSKLGVISGKATSTGTYSFTVQVTDTKTKTKPPVQQTATRLFSITIN